MSDAATPLSKRRLLSSHQQERFIDELGAEVTDLVPPVPHGNFWRHVAVQAPNRVLNYLVADGEVCPLNHALLDQWQFLVPFDEFETDGGRLPTVFVNLYDEPFHAEWKPDGGKTSESVKLVPHETRKEHVYRLVAEDKRPVPDLKFGWVVADE